MRPLDAASLPDATVHVLVRDFPEALVVLRRYGVDAALQGGDTLVGAAGARAAELCDALRRATAWREGASPRGCP